MKKGILLLCILSILAGSLMGCGVGESQEMESLEGRREVKILKEMTTVFRRERSYYVDSETGEKTGAYMEHYRNEYGLRNKVKTFANDGKLVDDSTDDIFIEEYDEQNRLISYKDNITGEKYGFQYDGTGKISEIGVYNKHDELRFYFKYSDREDAEYMRIGTDGYNYYFNENLQLVREEKVEGNQTTVWEINVYDEIGLLKEDFHKTKNYDRRKEYEYDENGNCLKEIGYKDNELWFENTYAYSEKGNLIFVVGLEFGRELSPKGKVYVKEEYTDEHYDEQGVCNYSYVNEESGKTLVKNDETWTYEYDEEGWLKKEVSNLGNYREFDEQGNMIEVFSGGMYAVRYAEYEIINDELLIAFYKYYGEEVF